MTACPYVDRNTGRGLVLAVVLLAATGGVQTAAGQTVTAFKTGEEATGMTKQCYYNALGSGHTLTLPSVELCPLSIQVRTPAVAPPPPPVAPDPPEPALVTAFFTGEQSTGMTKQCYYDALGSGYTKTISSVALCPLSIRVRPR